MSKTRIQKYNIEGKKRPDLPTFKALWGSPFYIKIVLNIINNFYIDTMDGKIIFTHFWAF